MSGVRRPLDDGDWNMAFLFPAEVAEARDRTGLIILPLAPVEWHGPHLAMGCDPLLAHAFARRLARELGTPYYPPLYIGTERERRPETLKALGFNGDEYIEGMDFPRNSVQSAYLREEVFSLVVRDVVGMLLGRFGFRRVLIVNGHGADNQRSVLDRLCRELNARDGAGARAAGGGLRIMWVYPGFPRSLIAGAIGHATAEETSMLASEWPACVDLSRLPASGPLANVDHAVVDGDTFDGAPTPDFTVRANQDPRVHSDAARGRTFIEEAVTEVLAEVREKLLG